MKKNKKRLYTSVSLLAAFAAWTLLVLFVDKGAIGPMGSSVGLASLNGFAHGIIVVNMTLYTVTDWLGLVPIAFALGFAILGLAQWIARKSLLRVDRSLFVLGGFYIAVIAAYVFFEAFTVNCRPVLIDGVLEGSYPSSTTMLVMCVMPSAAMQLGDRIKNSVLRRCIVITITVFTLFMVVGRLISGVHWITDIIGGALLSGGLVGMYGFFSNENSESKSS